ncbi:MAG: 5-carboxymethyl-2-hydroxymuconate Delta-isomerase [Alphaproteobacteria bacterium]|nr:5-carboxymethyl-2-hydroxymuconate Delta-isomerase [Alphaproteobacteria bacterium]MCD8519901.1 5-carboxymethyl-2-hydroxymuconate Delta-isomerase [Alphaproteobacteria bacterium]MCD8570881.1 5-carboxymethyl-2-hydroxymuconate Delta-isomerase [Alphaproteobacteria bacterium]
MPHIIVEYTDHLKVGIPELLKKLHFTLADQDTVALEAIKTRAIPVHDVVIADGNAGDKMIHVTLKLLPGRSDELKKTMAQALWQITRDHVDDNTIMLTAEVTELHAASYTK